MVASASKARTDDPSDHKESRTHQAACGKRLCAIGGADLAYMVSRVRESASAMAIICTNRVDETKAGWPCSMWASSGGSKTRRAQGREEVQ